MGSRRLLLALMVLACGCSRTADATAVAIGPSTAVVLEDDECGFPADGTRLERAQAGVPLLFRAAVLPDDATERLRARRERIIRNERAGFAPCGGADAYLRAVLSKLVRGSQLEDFAASFPEVELVTQCGPGTPIPGATAAPGHVLIVPRALIVLASSEDAIAAVLAHELAHFTLRHVDRLIEASKGHAYAGNGAGDIKNAHEREADITGLRIMVNAGYDPWAAVEHLELVDAIAQARLAKRRPCDGCRKPVHDARGVRVDRLRSQIRACRYSVPRTRTSVPDAVRFELISGAN